MYNNFSSKKTKKVISALLASALVVTSAPITADAATSKVLGVKKTFTVAGTKVTGLSKTEKKVVKVTIKNKKVTVKGLKAGKVTFKIGKKAYTVKVGATKIALTPAATSLKVNEKTKVAIVASNGKNDKLTVKTSNNSIVKISKSSVTANASGKASITLRGLAAGTSKITVTSKNTGKTASVKINVVADEVVTQAPVVSDSPVVSENPSESQAPVVSGDPSTSQAPATSNDPNASQAPSVTTAPAITATPAPVTASAIKGFSATNTQGQVLALNAVTLNGTIVVEFDGAVDKSTLNSATVKLTDATGTPIGLPSNDIKTSKDLTKAYINLDNTSLDKKATYTLTVDGAKSANNTNITKASTAFTVADKAVIKAIEDVTVPASIDNIWADNNAGSAAKEIDITFSDSIDSSTAVASNITLTDVSKNERRALSTITTTGKKVSLVAEAPLVDGKTYTLKISNLKTTTGIDAEEFVITFAVNGQSPRNGVAVGTAVTTFDNIVLNTTTNKAWPKLVAGTHEVVAGTNMSTVNYAGLQLKVQFSEKLDPVAATEYVKLIDAVTEKEVPSKITYDEYTKIVTIIPNEDLAEEAEYRVVTFGGLKTVQGVYLNRAKADEIIGADLSTFKTLGVTRPTVVSITSEDDTNNFKINEDHVFIVNFSKSISSLAYGSQVLLVESSAGVDKYLDPTYLYSGAVQCAAVPGTDGKSWMIKIPSATTNLQRDKAYKLIITGEDLIEDTALNASNILSDTCANALKKSYTTVFSSEAVDTTAPKVKNVYFGGKIDSSALLTTTKTNVVKGNKFTFEFDETISATVTGVTLEQYNSTTNTWGACTETVNTTVVKNDLNYDRGVAVEITSANSALSDGKYRIVFAVNSVLDTATVANGLEKKYVYEFVGSDGQDASSIQMGAIATNALTPQASGSVDTDAKIVVGFEESDIVNVTTKNVVVTDAAGNIVAGKLAEKAVTGGTYTGKVYVFTPDEKLKNATVYTITVDGVTDVTGNTITKSVAQYKTVAADVVVSGISIADGATAVDRQKTITITLSDAVDYLNGAYVAGKKNVNVTMTGGTGFTLSTNSGADGKPVAKLADDGKSVTITFTDSNKLEENTNYTITATTQKDGGAAWADVDNSTKTVKFTTGVAATDDVKPSFVAISENGGSSSLVETSGKYTVTATEFHVNYSEKIDAGSATVKIVRLEDSKEVGTLSVGSDVWNAGADKTALKFVLGSALTTGTYKVVISGVKDEAGNAADDKTVYFTV